MKVQVKEDGKKVEIEQEVPRVHSFATSLVASRESEDKVIDGLSPETVNCALSPRLAHGLKDVQHSSINTSTGSEKSKLRLKPKQTPLKKGSSSRNKQNNSTIYVEEHDLVKINMGELYPDSNAKTQLKAIRDPDV